MKKIKTIYSKKFSKKLIFVSQYFAPDYAATGQLLNQLVNYLSKKGIFCKVFTGMPSYSNNKKEYKVEISHNKEIYRDISSRIFPKDFAGKRINGILFSISSIVRIAFTSNKKNIYLFTSEPAYLPVIASIVSILLRKKYILLLYDLYPEILSGLGIFSKENFIIKIWKKLNRLIFNFSSEIIVLSDSMKSIILNYDCKLYHKIHVFPSWADPKVIKPIPREDNIFCRKNKLQNFFVVLYSGNQGRCHDMETIINSAKLLKNHKKILFLFIGKGFYNKELKKIAKNNNLKNCLFLPYQEFKDLPFSLTSADVAIVSVKKGLESLLAPSKLYGHLAAGTPILAISEEESFLDNLIKKWEFGYSIRNGCSDELANIIIKLFKNPFLKNELSKKGINYLSNNSTPEIVGDSYYDLISKHL